MNVVLLHGLGRGTFYFRTMVRALEREGHVAWPISYPSTRASVPVLAGFIANELEKRDLLRDPGSLAFVCHSMGGLVLRALPIVRPEFEFSKAVLLGSPIQGSILAERISGRPLMRLLLGPGVLDMRPAHAQQLPDFRGRFISIAGTRPSIFMPHTHLTRRFAPGQRSDSTVLVDETRHDRAEAHYEVDAPHHRLPSDERVQHLVLDYLSS